MVEGTYFKSVKFRECELGTDTYDVERGRFILFQTIKDMLDSKVILPNTKHSGLADRLCVSYLTEGYSGSYRPQGVLFKTESKPNYVSPFDVMALGDGDTFTSSDYHSRFLDGYEQFLFDSVDEMVAKYSNPVDAHRDLVEFRKNLGIETREKPFSYNECCFEDKVEIVPVGLVGQINLIFEFGKEFDLPIYPTTESYVKHTLNN